MNLNYCDYLPTKKLDAATSLETRVKEEKPNETRPTYLPYTNDINFMQSIIINVSSVKNGNVHGYM